MSSPIPEHISPPVRLSNSDTVARLFPATPRVTHPRNHPFFQPADQTTPSCSLRPTATSFNREDRYQPEEHGEGTIQETAPEDLNNARENGDNRGGELDNDCIRDAALLWNYRSIIAKSQMERNSLPFVACHWRLQVESVSCVQFEPEEIFRER